MASSKTTHSGCHQCRDSDPSPQKADCRCSVKQRPLSAVHWLHHRSLFSYYLKSECLHSNPLSKSHIICTHTVLSMHALSCPFHWCTDLPVYARLLLTICAGINQLHQVVLSEITGVTPGKTFFCPFKPKKKLKLNVCVFHLSIQDYIYYGLVQWLDKNNILLFEWLILFDHIQISFYLNNC